MHVLGSLVFISMQCICSPCMHDMLNSCIRSGVYDSMGVVTYAGVGAYRWTWGLHVHIGCTFRVCCLHVWAMVLCFVGFTFPAPDHLRSINSGGYQEKPFHPVKDIQVSNYSIQLQPSKKAR